MSIESLNKSLEKAADAAGYAMAATESDLVEWTVMQPEVALRNGHVSAASRKQRQISLPFARFEHWIEQILALPEFGRAYAPRLLLPSR